ncbi:alanine racemase [Thermocrinis albus DSM 14484]|uniref:Alanine racemase n=1 Tax=Thermocrinis albus (strain DSM 14484 / JCM 11386 / HI 11/12) TaxID=638303 RepID=D3SP81_THEAH|nr:alanine racemase [Thermocrinis albus]ADC88968.1 alanine racemase [Thermocrinis albus DSM 14484]
MRILLEINRDALLQNVKRINTFTGKKLIAVVKANAYGVGATLIASLLEPLEEVAAFAVACVEEGVELREAGVKKPILVLGGVLPEELEELVRWNLTPVVSHPSHLKALEGSFVKFHVKYDTGMGRLGFLEEIIQDRRVEGVMTHLSHPADRSFTLKQIETFRKIVSHYRGVKWVHLESSAGLIYRVDYATHVRVGLALYGEKPLSSYPIELSPALSLKARIISVKVLPAGHRVSYGDSCVLKRDTRVGVVAIGYADGLLKSLSGKARFYYRGVPVPLLGNITMDMTMVDLSSVEAEVGDWVEIVGPHQSFTQLAKEAGTIPYELMSLLSRRVHRVFA